MAIFQAAGRTTGHRKIGQAGPGLGAEVGAGVGAGAGVGTAVIPTATPIGTKPLWAYGVVQWPQNVQIQTTTGTLSVEPSWRGTHGPIQAHGRRGIGAPAMALTAGFGGPTGGILIIGMSAALHIAGAPLMSRVQAIYR